MRRINLLYGILAIILIFAISGCSTVPKKVKEELSGMKAKVDTLEARVEGVESKQSQVERETSEQSQGLIEELKAKGEKVPETNIITKSKERKIIGRTKEIQVALKNAGFYDGKIDGVKGRATKKAIKEFQQANGLKVDGKVGPKTWAALSKYAPGSRDPKTLQVTEEEGATK